MATILRARDVGDNRGCEMIETPAARSWAPFPLVTFTRTNKVTGDQS